MGMGKKSLYKDLDVSLLETVTARHGEVSEPVPREFQIILHILDVYKFS